MGLLRSLAPNQTHVMTQMGPTAAVCIKMGKQHMEEQTTGSSTMYNKRHSLLILENKLNRPIDPGGKNQNCCDFSQAMALSRFLVRNRIINTSLYQKKLK